MYCFSLVPCAVILHINRSHLFVNREMMEGPHILQKAILLLFMVYIFSEVK